MTGIWEVVFSPTGLALYLGFWVFKLTLGVWLLNKALVYVPVRVKAKWRARAPFLKGRQAK